jgi:hypothetical protein
MIYGEFIQVNPVIQNTPLHEHLFGNISHNTRITSPMGTRVDEQNIEGSPVEGEWHMFLFVNELTGRAVTVGTPGEVFHRVILSRIPYISMLPENHFSFCYFLYSYPWVFSF